MKKFKNFCKKPLLIISSVVFAVFMIALIVVCAVPHGGKYVGKTISTEGSDKYETRMEVTFKGDKYSTEMKFYKNGKELAADDVDFDVMPEMEYTIIDGKLFYGKVEKDDLSYKLQEKTAAKINSFKISYDKGLGLLGEDETALELTCGANIAILVISAVFAVVGAAGLATSIVFIAKDKKKKA